MKFRVHWNDGMLSIIEGNDIEDACHRAGIGRDTIEGVESFERITNDDLAFVAFLDRGDKYVIIPVTSYDTYWKGVLVYAQKERPCIRVVLDEKRRHLELIANGDKSEYGDFMVFAHCDSDELERCVVDHIQKYGNYASRERNGRQHH